MELYNAIYVKAYFDMTSKNALDIVNNAKSTIEYFEDLHKLLEKCDEYSWDGEDGQWIHVYACTDDKKLQKMLVDKYYFEVEEEDWMDNPTLTVQEVES